MTAQEIISFMLSLRNEGQRAVLMRFFKTGPGQYGHGDQFLGIKVPQTREVVRHCADLPLKEVPALLLSPWHEVRLCGFLILVARFESLAKKRLVADEDAIRRRDEIVRLYLTYARQANNWDLVDLSAPRILGAWLLLPTHLEPADLPLPIPASHPADVRRTLLDALAQSDCLWLQRMSIVSTWTATRHGQPEWALHYAEVHLRHPHDLIHKAVGWMLRDVGERCGLDLLRQFLEHYAPEMPRTALRYAIEKLPPEERKKWMTVPRA